MEIAVKRYGPVPIAADDPRVLIPDECGAWVLYAEARQSVITQMDCVNALKIEVERKDRKLTLMRQFLQLQLNTCPQAQCVSCRVLEELLEVTK